MSEIERLAREAAKQLQDEMNPRADHCGNVYEFEGGLHCDVDGSVDLHGLVRAILEAMREPSEAMLEAAATGLDSGGYGITRGDAGDVWAAMLNTILESK